MSDTEPGIGVEASFTARLFAGLDAIAEKMERSAKRTEDSARLVQQAAALMPITYRRRAQGFPASNVLVLDMGGPAQGRVWELRSMKVGSGGLPSETRAGAAYVYAMSGATPDTVLGAASIFDAIDWTTSLPNVAFYGAGEAVVVAGERLYVVFTGATNAEDYGAAFVVQDRLSTPTDRTTVAQ